MYLLKAILISIRLSLLNLRLHHSLHVQPLEQLVLKRHVILRLKANTRAEDVNQARALLSQRIDNRRTSRRKRSLQYH